MLIEDWKIVDLGSVTADTRGNMIGIVDGEFGRMLLPGLHDD
jgi:hypothetical protein